MKKIFVLMAAAMMAICAWAEVVTLDLNDPRVPATLEYNDNCSWSGTYSEDVQWLQFGDQFLLSHAVNGTYGGYYWDGFVPALGGDQTDYAPESGSSNDWISHAWGCMAGGGVKVENGHIVSTNGVAEADPAQPYLSCYWGYYAGAASQTNIVKFVDDQAYDVLGAYVCNSPWAYYGTQHGDGFARAFEAGDKLTLTAVGVAEDGTETSVDFDLVTFDTELHAVNDWTYFDLSSLGKVKQVYFTMTSTDAGAYGNNTANLFCMDKFQISVPDGVLMGDVNGDGSLSMADVTTLIDAVLGNQPEPYNESAADVNGDGSISMADVTTLLAAVLGQE